METVGVDGYTDEKFTNFVRDVSDPFIDQLVRNLEDHFQDSPVLLAFQALDPQVVNDVSDGSNLEASA